MRLVPGVELVGLRADERDPRRKALVFQVTDAATWTGARSATLCDNAQAPAPSYALAIGATKALVSFA